MPRLQKTFNLKTAFATVDACQDKYLQRLQEFIRFKSISDEMDYRLDVEKAILWYAKKLKDLDFKVDLRRPYYKDKFYLGHEVPYTEFEMIEFPDIILAQYNNDVSKPTILIYAHVDVRPVEDPSRWPRDPWELNIDEEILTARGIADQKGPMIAWLSAMEVLTKCAPTTVNVKMIIEGMAERNSEFLEDILIELRPTFLSDIDYVVMSDDNWLNTQTPCITFGMRGYMYFHVEMRSGEKAIHSGVYGGISEECMSDLAGLMSAMVKENNTVLIPGFYEQVNYINDRLSVEEWNAINFKKEDAMEQEKINRLMTKGKVDTLKTMWTMPLISFHGIEHTFDQPFSSNRIPPRAMLKFSVRTVPDMNIYRTRCMIENFIRNHFKKVKTINECTIK